MLNKVSILLHDFRSYIEKYNLSQAESRLDDTTVTSRGQLKIVLVMDADSTLTAEDIGALFWERVSSSRPLKDSVFILNALFRSYLGYLYTTFRQTVLLHEETADD